MHQRVGFRGRRSPARSCSRVVAPPREAVRVVAPPRTAYRAVAPPRNIHVAPSGGVYPSRHDPLTSPLERARPRPAHSSSPRTIHVAPRGGAATRPRTVRRGKNQPKRASPSSARPRVQRPFAPRGGLDGAPFRRDAGLESFEDPVALGRRRRLGLGALRQEPLRLAAVGPRARARVALREHELELVAPQEPHHGARLRGHRLRRRAPSSRSPRPSAPVPAPRAAPRRCPPRARAAASRAASRSPDGMSFALRG